MIITDSNLELVYRGFKAVYNTAFEAAETHKDTVAMTVNSGTAEENYGWLGQFPALREWIGERIIKELSSHGFRIENRKFESTVKVKREHIEDDRIGVYKPMFSEVGRATKQHPDELIFSLLKKGFETLCYDGQNFFDPEHPVIHDNQEVAVSNMQEGEGPAWYLLDTSRAIRPIIWQERIGYDFQQVRDPASERVFLRDEYLFGVRARVNCGLGLWQLAYGSRAPLTPENYATARRAMMGFVGDQGHLLGIKPTHLVVPGTLEEDALRLLTAETIEGTSNIWRNTAQLIIPAQLG